MNKLRSWFFKTVPEEHANEFRMEIIKENISRIQIYSFLFLFFEICFITYGIFNYFEGIWAIETKYKQIFFLHLGAFSLIIIFIIALFARKNKDNPSPAYIFFEFFFITVILIWAIVFTIANLYTSDTLVPFIITCLSISIAIYIHNIFSFFVYTCSFVLITIGMYYNCDDLRILHEHITESGTIILISFIISRIFYQNKIDFFLYQKKIENEINAKDQAELSLQKMNSNLELIIKDRTQALITINDQLNKEISDKQILEQKLLTEKNTLNNIIEFNPYSIAVFDKNGYYLRGNNAGVKLFKQEPPPEYCIFNDPQLSNEVHQIFEQLKNGETVIFPEIPYNPSKYGEDFPNIELTLKTTMFPIQNTQGEIENFIQMHADLTDRVKAEAELRISEEKYRLIVEDMEEGIYSTKNGIFMSVNNAMVKMFGFSTEELIGMPAWNLAIHEKREEVKAELFAKTIIKDTSPLGVECLKKNGDVFFAEIRISGTTNKGLTYGIVSDISEKKHAEEILKESEEKYKLLVNNITEVIFLLDIKGNISYISDLFETITDYKIENIIGKPLLDLVYIDDLPGVLNSYSNTLSGTKGTLEFRIVLKNGTYKHVKTISKLIVKEDNTKQIIGLMQEIEEQKSFEKSLIVLNSAINQATDGISISSMDGIFIYVNEAWATMHDYSQEELIGQNLNICHSETQLKNDLNPFNEIVIKNGYSHANIGHVNKDGIPFLTWMHTSILKDKNNISTGILSVARNITNQNEIENQLHANEEKYRILFQNSPSGIFLINLNGDIIDANKALLNMLGSNSLETTKSLNALTFSNLIESGISQKLQECIATGKVIISEHSYNSKWGKSILARIHFKPITDIDQNITGVQATAEDITEFKENELKHKELMDLKFAEAEHHKKLFMENLSNAIRVPVNMIQGFSNILKKSDLSEKKYKFIANSIVDKSRVLVRNVNNITLVTQLETKTLEFNKTFCSPEGIIQSIIDNSSEIFEPINKKVELRKNKNCDKQLEIFTDSQKLSIILSELLDNSIKNTHYGFIEIGFNKEEDDTIIFYVTDTGTGISPNKQKDFFSNLLSNIESTDSEKHPLGLIICKGIVEQLGGSIWMKSEEGRGTSFYFSLPIKP